MSRNATARVPRITPRAKEEEAAVVALYAKIHDLKAELKELEGDARERATELYEGFGLTSLQGHDGSVAIKYVEGAERLDTTRVRQLLTPQQLEKVTVVGEPTLRISFTGRRQT